MPHDYFVRITYAYDKIASMVSLWACRAEKMVVYEHIGTKTEKVHCHILILGCNIHKKQLRNLGATCVSLKGNELCSFKECTSWETPVVYMTKGNLDPKYIKGFERSEADVWKSKWVEPIKYEKVSKDVKLFEDFWTDELYERFQSLRRPEDEDMDKVVYYQYYWILREARTYAFGVNGGIWNMRARNIYYMCSMTACMRAQIPISKKHKFAEILQVYLIPITEYNMPGIRVAGVSAMRYKRRLRKQRQRRVRRVGRVGKGLRRAIQSVVKRNQETKYVANSLDIGGVALGAIWPVKPNMNLFTDIKPAIPSLTEGAGDYQRIGSKIQPTSLAVSLKMTFNANDLSANELMAVVYYGTDRANRTFQGGNSPIQSTAILNNGDGTNKSWTGLLNDLNFPTDKTLFNIKRKVFRLSKTGGNMNSDIGGQNNGAFSTSNGLSEVSTLLKFRPPKTLLYNNDTDTYPSNYAPFFYVGFCHADGSALTPSDYDPTTKVSLVYAASRCHMWYKDA